MPQVQYTIHFSRKLGRWFIGKKHETKPPKSAPLYKTWDGALCAAKESGIYVS